jgi:hypothetical protein
MSLHGIRLLSIVSKEDWLFNENTSTMLCRIIGIAPVVDAIDGTGNSLGDEVMYWVYYPDLRPILSQIRSLQP